MSSKSAKVILLLVLVIPICFIICGLCISASGFILLLNNSTGLNDNSAQTTSTDLAEQLFVGTQSTDIQAELYFIPFCYDTDPDCYRFMQTTLPYLLRDGQKRYWYGLKLRAHNIHSSAVPPMLAAYGMLCAAEQDKTVPYLLSYVTWMEEAKFIESQNLKLTNFEKQKLTEIGLDSTKWLKCIDDQTYSEQVWFRAKTGSDQAMILRFDTTDKSQDLLYPTVEQVQSKLEQRKNYYDQKYGYDPASNYKK